MQRKREIKSRYKPGFSYLIPLVIKDISGTRQRLTVWLDNVNIDLQQGMVYSFKNLSTDKYPSSEEPPYSLKTTANTKVKQLSAATQMKFKDISLNDFVLEGNLLNQLINFAIQCYINIFSINQDKKIKPIFI